MRWFVIANKDTAKIYIHNLEDSSLTLRHSIQNPLGEVKRRDLVRKEAGHGIKRAGRYGIMRYIQNRDLDPRESATNQFAKQLTTYLDKEWLAHRFDSLTVVAEPHFLGKIRANMTKRLKNKVTDWVLKDLLKTPQSELASHLFNESKEI